MKLKSLLPKSGYSVFGPDDIEISGITYDSRKVKNGHIFFALKGEHFNGVDFIDETVKSGAVCIVSDKKVDFKSATLVVTENINLLMAEISTRFYAYPDKDLLMVGITGTNGKTTISYMLESIFKEAKINPGIIGTINYRYGGQLFNAPNTTPQSADVYQILNDMVKIGSKAAIIEVSSHALALGRISCTEFDIAIFTNLTQDHLDFHISMEDYFNAKTKLFTDHMTGKKKFKKYAIINTDDIWGKKLISISGNLPVITYGMSSDAGIRAENIKISTTGTEFKLISPFGNCKIRLNHLGKHNVYNALASITAALYSDIDLDTVISGLEKLKSVPGRLEKIDIDKPYTVVIDYAHTDDALKNVLIALREIKPERIITVFGCGGDRDRTKRPLMGEIASELSDFVFITSDNPRSESPESIILDIEVGIKRKYRTNYKNMIDREQAIAAAIKMAQKGDIVLIAGKGHETYQIIGDKKIDFSDTEIAKQYMSR